MHNKKPKPLALAGDQGQATTGTGLLQPHHTPFCLTCQPIPVVSGGPIAWGICDGIFTLARELVARGLVVGNDDLSAAIRASWAEMSQASYLTAEDRAAWGDEYG